MHRTDASSHADAAWVNIHMVAIGTQSAVMDLRWQAGGHARMAALSRGPLSTGWRCVLLHRIEAATSANQWCTISLSQGPGQQVCYKDKDSEAGITAQGHEGGECTDPAPYDTICRHRVGNCSQDMFPKVQGGRCNMGNVKSMCEAH